MTTDDATGQGEACTYWRQCCCALANDGHCWGCGLPRSAHADGEPEQDSAAHFADAKARAERATSRQGGSMASKPKRKLVREIVRYRCQFCGREAAAKRWTLGGTRCPNCQSDYDARLAQDEETD